MNMNVSKRLFALVMCAFMLVSSLVFTVSAADATQSTGEGYQRKSLAELTEAFNTISYETYKTNLTEHYDADKALSEVSGLSLSEIAGLTVRKKKEAVASNIDAMNKRLRTGKSVMVDVTSYVVGDATTAQGLQVLNYKDALDAEKKALLIPDSGMVTWTVNVPESGLYAIRFVYCSASDKKNSIERNFYVNGAIPFTEARSMTLTKTWRTPISALTEVTEVAAESDEETLKSYCILGEDGKYYRFAVDSSKNEIKPNMGVSPEWVTADFKDSDGMYSVPFEFYFEKGENTIALKGVREAMYLASIELFTLEDRMTYDEYHKSMADKYGDGKGSDVIKLQAELPSAVSNYTIYPVYDRSSAITEPQHATQIIRNTIGAEKWENAGQWIEYSFTIENAGFYSIAPRFKQSILAGLYVSRAVYIDGVIPFDGAASVRFDYDDDWQNAYIGSEDGTPYEFYLTAGTHTLRMEVAMGSMGAVVKTVEDIQSSLNTSYLEILKLTGTEPDEYRDYGFMRIMPNTIRNLLIQRDNLKVVLEELSGEGGLSANTVIFQQLITLLTKMGNEQSQIAKNLSELKNELGTLGEWTNGVGIQPLEVDYIAIQSSDKELPRATATFFQSFGFQMKQFFGSFVTDYNSLSAGDEGVESDASVQVWVQSGRDQAQITRSIIQNEYKGAVINLKLVADGTLLPAVLSGTGPDVSLDGVKASASLSQAMGSSSGTTGTTAALSNGSGDVVNYAIRNAIEPLNQFTRSYLDGKEGYEATPSFEEVITRFSPAALTPLTLYGTTYALPAKQTWPMMFVRTDILADLGENIPATWDDLMALLPVLQYNNMTIGLTTDYTIYLYQGGGQLWADDGMRINLDSNVALGAFKKMCDMFTQYSLPYNYSPYNRFRTGEMPIFIGEYESSYNTLVVFATEIAGVWDMAPIPGTIDADGNLNNVSVSTVTGVVMLRDVKNKEAAWNFMTWYTDKEFQVEYSNELVAVVGPAAKNATANMAALEELDWTHDEYEALYTQMQNLVSVEAYPGSYIIFRYTNFAFLDAYNDMINPADALLGNISSINKEITRKRKEFNLETVPAGKTLAQKRMSQASDLIANLPENVQSAYSAELKAVQKALDDASAEALLTATDALAKKVKAETGYLYATENSETIVNFTELDGEGNPMWWVKDASKASDDDPEAGKFASDSNEFTMILLCKYLYDAASRL